MKKYLLLVLLTMIMNMVGVQFAFAEDHGPRLNITKQDNYTATPGYDKFAEPLVTVTSETGGVTKTLTNQYNIKYYISGHENDAEASMQTNSRKAKITTDATTGTQVELVFGNVIFGDKEGDVTIKVIATEKANTENKLEGSYTVAVHHPAAQLSFSPNLTRVGDKDGITFYVKQTVKPYQYDASKYVCSLTNASTAIPTPKVMINYNGIDRDITSCYNISYSLTEGGDAEFGGTHYNTLGLDNERKTISYTGTNQYNPEQFDNEETAKAYFHSDATLRYTFTLKGEYTGKYPALADKDIAIKFEKVTGEAKIPLQLNLTREMILLDNVTSYNYKDSGNDADNSYVLHVYKYGSQNHTEQGKYQYCTPNPALTTTGGAVLPVQGKRGSGSWGDFQYFYQIIDGNVDGDQYAYVNGDVKKYQLGTYFDNCGVAPFYIYGETEKAGRNTGLTISEDKFQTNKPGLVKVAVYGALQKYAAKDELTALYQPIMEEKDGVQVEKTLKNQWGTEYVIYTEPVYFYIDVMKRVPTLSFDPNPNELTFAKGDRIDMTNRFNVSGHITDNSNGIEGDLTWGANSGNFEDDHFAYTFFVSQHAAQVIKVHDWPCTFTKFDGEKNEVVSDWDAWAQNTCQLENEYGEMVTYHGDQYSFIDYQVLKATDNIVTNPQAHPMVGDRILDTANHVYVEVTDENYNSYKDLSLKEGDMIKGITYFSVKGFGAAFEKWYLTFDYEGTYDITYTIRPWNHTRWDIGSNAAGTVTYNYTIVTAIDTELQLSYYETVAEKNAQWDFDEPDKKVIVPSSNNEVTKHFNLHFEIDPTTVPSGYTIVDETINEGEHQGEYSVYKKGDDVVLKVNKTTGEVFVGNLENEDVKIKVYATRKNAPEDPDGKEHVEYNVPTPKVYTVHIKDLSGNAKWEILSECNGDAVATANPRFTAEEFKHQSGRFHFIGAGEIVGGSHVTGVPGITMTIGAPGDEEWKAEVSTINTLKKCCKHENEHNPVIVDANTVSFDKDGMPVSGTFYRFDPTANGFLGIDANWQAGNNVNLLTRNSKTGEITIETIEVETTVQDDKFFTKPLIAGETYYLYNATAGNLRLHGFVYEPAYVADANTTKAESTTGIEASLFMNGFASNVPSITASKNEYIDYNVVLKSDGTTDASEYLEIGANGELTPKKMTVADTGDIFQLKVIATVESTNRDAVGDCTDKQTFYYLQIIDIPTYKLGDYDEYNSTDGVTNGMKVRTTNIPTAMTMTFSGWKDDNGNGVYNKTKEDQWTYKSVAGAASRIGSELDDDDPTYNKTIDGFGYYNAGNQNPVDENNKGALQKDNNNSYLFASGTEAEQSTAKYYNTTYKLPCRGAFVKFEPEESGILLVYLVQNGCVDYHYGITNVSTQYKLKWRPLYITDETGKPVDMIGDSDTDFENVKKYLPTNAETTNLGAFTLGLSRCNKEEDAIEEAKQAVTASNPESYSAVENCSFDWSEFRGTESDKTKLLAAWSDKGNPEQIIRLDNGGFALPHKAYVRYTFKVKAGKTYFVFQPGSKYEFGGFSFVPAGYPATSKYGLVWNSNSDADIMKWVGKTNIDNQEINTYNTGAFTWKDATAFTADEENLNITINDCRASDYTNGKNIARNFTAGQWTSLCVPFSVSEKQCQELFGENSLIVTCDGVNDKDQLHFVRHANQYIEAGRPYFIKPSKNGTFAFKNVTIEGAESSTVTTSIDANSVKQFAKIVNPDRFNVDISDQEYTFRGIYKRETIPAGSFFMLNDIPGNDNSLADGLYRYDNDYKIGGYRAYYQVVKNSAKAFGFVMDDKRTGESDVNDDITTGIIFINGNDEMKTFPKNAAVYDLNGIKIGDNATSLNRAHKGIYIVNGQKVVIR